MSSMWRESKTWKVILRARPRSFTVRVPALCSRPSFNQRSRSLDLIERMTSTSRGMTGSSSMLTSLYAIASMVALWSSASSSGTRNTSVPDMTSSCFLTAKGRCARISRRIPFAITTATRRRSFERVYDLTERVIPAPILALPTPSAAEAHRTLIEKSARALGIATAAELRDYFRLAPKETQAAIATLVEEGILIPAAVPGWPQAFLHHKARRPRRIPAQALLAPFDPLIWERTRTERLFGFRYRTEIYVPAEKREHGYYVLPFLLGERLVARVDVKADRMTSRLLVQAVHYEPGSPSEGPDALEAELAALARWLGLAEVTVETA